MPCLKILTSFANSIPRSKVLKPQLMVRDGISAKLHKGAEKYYREKGLL